MHQKKIINKRRNIVNNNIQDLLWGIKLRLIIAWVLLLAFPCLLFIFKSKIENIAIKKKSYNYNPLDKFKYVDCLEPNGLINEGITCFLNAPLQCILSNKYFVNYFMKYDFNKDELPHHYYTRKFIVEYIHAKSSLSLSSFIKVLREKIEILKENSMQDSMDFLNAFLNLFEDEITQSKIIESHKDDLLKQFKEIFQIGLQEKFTYYNCLRTNINNHPYYALPLAFEPSLVNAFQNFFIKVILNEEFKDTKRSVGDEYVNSSTFKITSYPKILILSLKRFIIKAGSVKKINDEVTIEPCILVDKIKYNLIGVVSHLGSGLNSGHYVSLAKRNNNVYLFDDSSISQYHDFDSQNDVINLSKNPYIVFYSRNEENTL